MTELFGRLLWQVNWQYLLPGSPQGLRVQRADVPWWGVLLPQPIPCSPSGSLLPGELVCSQLCIPGSCHAAVPAPCHGEGRWEMPPRCNVQAAQRGGQQSLVSASSAVSELDTQYSSAEREGKRNEQVKFPASCLST